MNRRKFIKNTSFFIAGITLPAVLINCTKKPKEPVNPNPEKKLKVLIIGAGIAGLSAASSLQKEGYEVKVIEASNRYGGRINSIDFNGDTVDAGASWIHGITGNPLYSLSQQNAIITRQTHFEPSYIFDIDGSEITEEDWSNIEPYLNQLVDIAYDNQDLSLQGLLEIIAPQLNLTERLKRLFYGAVRSEIEIPYAIDAKDISARALLVDDSFPGEDVVFPGGMHQLTDVLAQGIDISYNSFVYKIDYSGDQVAVYVKKYSEVDEKRACYACHHNTNANNLSEDEVFSADKVIVALPLEMLKRENVIFSPAFSNTRTEALNALEMGIMNKVFLKFEENFWYEDAYFLEFLKEDYSNVIEFFSPTPTGLDNILVAVLAGHHAKRIETMSDAEVEELVMSDLKGMFGNNIPSPTAITRTAWHSDPLALGAYPHLKPAKKMTVCDTIANDLDMKVFFAGDFVVKEYLATAHGAYISGIRAAQKIMDSVMV